MIDDIAKRDRRGLLSTIYREAEAGALRQWNCIKSHANVLRGLHAHLTYDELYATVQGRMFVVLKDARLGSPSFGAEISFWSEEIHDRSLFVPSGVAHSVYFVTDGILLYGLSRAWTGDGEFACRWDDPEIGAIWPGRNPTLSERDAAAGSFSQMAAALEGARKPALP